MAVLSRLLTNMRIVPQFRRASPDEIAALEALQRRTAMISDYREAILAHPDAIEISLQAVVDGHARVALLANKVIGFSIVLPSRDGRAELDGLFVEPDVWKQGTGTRLVEEAARLSASRAAEWLYVVGNPNARGFYETCAFEYLGEEQTRFGPGLNMRKRLPARPGDL